MDETSYYVPKVHFELIKIKNLVSNQEYQRNLSMQHIHRTAANFDPKRWKQEFKEAHPYILQMKAIPCNTRYLYKITSISTLPIRLFMFLRRKAK